MRWLVVVMLACGMQQAHAQPAPPAPPEPPAQPDPFGAPHGGNSSDLFNEGRRLVSEGRIDQACVRFEESWRVEEAIGTALNLADCRERQGQLVQARILFLRALEIAKRTGDATRESFAQNRVTALEAHLATLQVYLTPPVDSTLALTIDGAQLVHFGAGQRELLEPRVVRLRAITSMGMSWETDVKLRAGARELVEVPSLVTYASHRKMSWKIAAASLAGGSVVSLLVGGLLHADAEGRNPREGTRCSPLPDGSVYCPTVGDAQKLQDNADSIDRMRLIGDTMLVAGTGLLVSAVVVYALAPRTTVALNVVATRHTSGVTFTARF